MKSDSTSIAYPPLTPIVDPWVEEVFEDRAFIDGLFEEYGSPINLHHPRPFRKNYERFAEVFDRHSLSHTVFFARKANPCKVFVKHANLLSFGVDTASLRELEECLEMGVEKLVLTAAVKTEELVHLALHHDVLMILDNEDECRLVNRVAKELGRVARIGVRISGFRFEGAKLYSRFGFDIDHVFEFISSKLGPGYDYENLRFEGLHFHLDGYSTEQRSEALLQSVALADRLLTRGIRTSFIDMGGGILMNYLSSASEWRTFWSELKKAVRGERDPVTFGNNGLGYELIDGELHGVPNVYPYLNETSQGDFLEEVLTYRNARGETPASMLREREIEIRIEPGRSLLDQTGITMARVVHRKKDSLGDWLIGLEMNRSQLYSSSADFLLDPVYIPTRKKSREARPTPVFLTGGYCLEQDLILKRKIVLPCLPETSDAVCFPNTAGYMMHFYETRSHLYDFSTNLVMDETSDTLAVYKDEM